MAEPTYEPVKALLVTRQECELIMDSVRLANTATRALALKTAGLVLEFAGLDAIGEAGRVLTIHQAVCAEAEAQHESRRGPERAVDAGPGAPASDAA